jgi:hypothetical protein
MYTTGIRNKQVSLELGTEPRGAEMWQYCKQECSQDISLYSDRTTEESVLDSRQEQEMIQTGTWIQADSRPVSPGDAFTGD